MAGQLKQLAIADQVLLAEIDGRAVGFSITLPDINEAIRPLNGRLTRFGLPLGLLKLLRRKRHIKTARMVVLDVLKEYRRRGVAEMLILHTLDYGKNVLGYTGAELVGRSKTTSWSTAPSKPWAASATKRIASTRRTCRRLR